MHNHPSNAPSAGSGRIEVPKTKAPVQASQEGCDVDSQSTVNSTFTGDEVVSDTHRTHTAARQSSGNELEQGIARLEHLLGLDSQNVYARTVRLPPSLLLRRSSANLSGSSEPLIQSTNSPRQDPQINQVILPSSTTESHARRYPLQVETVTGVRTPILRSSLSPAASTQSSSYTPPIHRTPSPRHVIQRSAISNRDSFSEAVATYVSFQRQRISAGIPVHDIVPNRTVDVRPMIASTSIRTDNVDTLDDFIAKLVAFNQFTSPAVKLAMMHLRYQLLRWQVYPTQASFEAVPPCMRPTHKQLGIVHSPWIDYFAWPDIRDLLIDNPAVLGSALFSQTLLALHQSMRLRWEYKLHDALLVDNETGQINLTPAFQLVCSDLENWDIDDGPLRSLVHAQSLLR